MKLLLCRHGNTFNSSAEAVWVGAKQDVPLVAGGRAQAEDLGTALKDNQIKPVRALAAPLQRTTGTLDIALKKAGLDLSVSTDNRLTEIDYGLWGGRHNDDLIAEYGLDMIDNWREHGIWPENMAWQPDLPTIKKGIQDLAADLSAKRRDDDLVMICSSNGILRYFLTLLPGGLAHITFNPKVKTGHCCLLSYEAEKWHLSFWNALPNSDLFCSHF